MKKIKQVILLLVIIGILGINNCVNANSFNFTATPNSTSIEPGETVEIALNVSNIDAGENGINTIEAVLEYDENIFEPVTSSDFSGLNNWSITYNAEDGEYKGKFIAVIVQDGVKEDQAIGTLKLKTKSEIADQLTKVTIKNIKTNDGTEEITTQDQVISIDIKNPVIPEEPNDEQNNQQTNTINQATNTIKKDDSLSPKILPAAGERMYLIFGLLIAVIVIGGIAYIKYKDMKNI